MRVKKVLPLFTDTFKGLLGQGERKSLKTEEEEADFNRDARKAQSQNRG